MSQRLSPRPSDSSVRRWLATLARWGWWAIVTGLALSFIERDALRYVEWTSDVYLRFWPNRWLLVIHVAGATVALLVGPLQFSRRLRARWPKVHRMVGWTYVLAVIISTPFAIRLSAFSSCPLCTPPFMLWGTITLLVTVIAVVAAVYGSYKVHREFMLRSYILMYAFVLVRLDFHLIGTPFEVPLPSEVERNSMVIWLSWLVPLLLVEVLVSWWPSLKRILNRPSRAHTRS